MENNDFKKKDRNGSNNPMWGRHHNSISKQKQSEAAKRRWAEVKKMQAIHHTTMDEFLSNEAFTSYVDKIISDLLVCFLMHRSI